MNCSCAFFFRMLKIGAPHCEKGCLTKTPSLTNLATFFLRVSKWMWGIGKALPWYGAVPGFNWNFMGSVFQSHSVLLNNSLNSISSLSKRFHWDTVKCLQFLLTTCRRFAFLYLASYIVTALLVASCIEIGSVKALNWLLNCLGLLILSNVLIGNVC